MSAASLESPCHYVGEILAAKHDRRPPITAGPLGEWLQRNHALLCDYLIAHLDGLPELRAWIVAYTALHELLGAVWLQPRSAGEPHPSAPADPELWASFDAGTFVEVYLPVMAPFSLLPEDFSPRGFHHHYEGFFHFAAHRGLMRPHDADRLAAELRLALWGEAGVA